MTGVGTASRPDARTVRPRVTAFLVGALVLVISAPQVSDIGAIRTREIGGDRLFEYPVLARVVYVAERAVAHGPTAIAVLNAVVEVIAAGIALALLLRNDGSLGGVGVAVILLLVGQNFDGLTLLALVIALVAAQRGRYVRSGAVLGVVTALRVVPAVIIVPLAFTEPPRHRRGMILAAATVWLAVNVPFAAVDFDRWAQPYRFARTRTDVLGTVWAPFHLSTTAVNAMSAVLLLTALAVIAAACARRRLAWPHACVLAIAALLVTSKVWQPHYALWLVACLAFVEDERPLVPFVALEVASLGYFVVLWKRLYLAQPGPWIWLTASARLASLVAFAVVTALVSRPRRSADLA